MPTMIGKFATVAEVANFSKSTIKMNSELSPDLFGSILEQ